MSKRVFKKVGQLWTNLKKIIIQPVKNKLFKHHECHQKTNIINQQYKYTKIILKTKIFYIFFSIFFFKYLLWSSSFLLH